MDPLAKIFGSPARLKLLRLFLFNDDTSFSLADAAARARIQKDAARKETHLLATAGLVRKRKVNGAVAYSANRRFAHYAPLVAFLRETTGLRDVEIVNQLRKAGTVRLVALSGLFTGVIETKIDLLVVGDRLDERALAAAIRVFESELGRELRYASFSTEDFRYRVGVYDRLVRDVFDYPHRTLLDKIGM